MTTSLEQASREAMVALRRSRQEFNTAVETLIKVGALSSMEDADALERRCGAVDQGYLGLIDEVAKLVGRERLGELIMEEMKSEDPGESAGTD